MSELVELITQSLRNGYNIPPCVSSAVVLLENIHQEVFQTYASPDNLGTCIIISGTNVTGTLLINEFSCKINTILVTFDFSGKSKILTDFTRPDQIIAKNSSI